ncbi:NUDIX hydrolase [Streptomyces lasiicapitis]|uniref:NUDIX hydrolase n=1 Tax=Streptomyces lasiicapitis TaxID=1923961 RepID=UPI00331DE393
MTDRPAADSPSAAHQLPGAEVIENENETEAVETEAETIRLTADVVATTPDGYVLLIQRGDPPYKGEWALPGGWVDRGEKSDAAGARELAEESGVFVDPGDLVQIGAFDRPDRDPRGRFVTVAYRVGVPAGTRTAAGDDADDARWWPVGELPPLAFDHADIISAALKA